MLITRTVQMRWVSNLKKWYEEKGYNYTGYLEYFECKVEDLMPTSTVKVEVKCDYCKERISIKPYRVYLRERKIIQKDCCKKRTCMVQKSEESNLITYEVRNINQTDKRKQEAREMFQTPKEEVLRVAKSKGIRILNIESYQNDRTRLKIICSKHENEGIQDTNFANIKKNKYCCQYINKEIEKGIKRIDGEQVIEEFKMQNLIPLFTSKDYVNNNTSLPYICPNHKEVGTQYRSRANLFNTVGCSHCAHERTAKSLRMSESDLKKRFIEKDLVLLDPKEYKNNDIKLSYYCIKHPGKIQKISVANLRLVKVPCAYCREEKNLSSLNKRLRSSIGTWRKDSIEKSNFRCILTGANEYDVHHLYSFNSIILDCLKILNIEIKSEYSAEELVSIRRLVVEKHKDILGVCLHPQLHIEFHRIYKKNNNTPEQFEEFKQRYRNGEFDYLLGKGSEAIV